MKKLVLAASSALVLAACGTAAQAADLSIVYNFTRSGTTPLNRPQAALTINASGDLFGTALANGASSRGGVYKLARQSDGSYADATTVATFGSTVNAAIGTEYLPVALDAAGNIYGAASSGGANSAGAVYKIAAGTSTVTTLASFVAGTAAGSTGASPRGAVVVSGDGTVWGTNLNSGVGNGGTVYKVAPDSGVVTVVASFGANGLSGYSASSGLIADKQGNLYGSTQYTSGSTGSGTLFKVDTITGTVTTLATLTGGSEGRNPFMSLAVDDDGNLFGATAFGGAKGAGSVFKLAVGESSITTLASLDAATTGTGGWEVIVDAVGNLFGVTQSGSSTGTAAGGAVWKLGAGSSTVETLASFTASGTGPRRSYGGLVADAQGNLYGTTSQGGTNNLGTVFKLANTGYGVAPSVTPPAAAAVPEPATWGMMLLGFGLVGSTVRRRRLRVAAVHA